MSLECVGGDARGPLVAVDHSRHDVARLEDLQGLSGIARTDRDECADGAVAEARRIRGNPGGERRAGRKESKLRADRERDRVGAGLDGDGVMGGDAREDRESGARQGDAEGQGRIQSRDSGAMEEKASEKVAEHELHDAARRRSRHFFLLDAEMRTSKEAASAGCGVAKTKEEECR